MSEKFDPYHKWLGIPPDEQPADHYRLLGIGLFENDPDVIEGAADRQMAHVQTHKLGPHAAASQQLLNKLAMAKITLLHPAKRSAYDQSLRATLGAQSTAAAISTPAAVPAAAPTGSLPVAAATPSARDALDFVSRDQTSGNRPYRREGSTNGKRPGTGKRTVGLTLFIAPALLLVVGIVGLIAWRSSGSAVPPQPVKLLVAAKAAETSKNDVVQPPGEGSSQAPGTAADPKSTDSGTKQSLVERTAASLPDPPSPPIIAKAATSHLPAGVKQTSAIKVLQEANKHRSTKFVAISRDGNWLFWSGGTNVPGPAGFETTFSNILWDLRDDTQSSVLSSETKLYKAAFTANGKQLITLTSSGATAWELPTMRAVHTWNFPANTAGGAFTISADGSCVATFEDQLHTAVFVDSQSGEALFRATDLPGNGTMISLSADAKYALVGGVLIENRKTIGSFHRVYDLRARKALPIDLQRPERFASSCVFSAHDTLAIMAPKRKENQIWNIPQQTLLSSLPRGQDINGNCLAFTPDGNGLLSTDGEKLLKLWNLSTREVLESYVLPVSGYPRQLEITADGRRAVFTSSQGSVLLLSLPSGEGPQGPAAAATPPEIRLPVVADPASPKSIEPAAADQFAPARILQDGVEHRSTRCIAISPDGRWVFWSGQTTVFDEQRKGNGRQDNLLWDLSQGVSTSAFAMQSWLQAAAFTADSKQLVLVFPAEAIVWELSTRRVVHTSRIISGTGVYAIAPDGSCVATLESQLDKALFTDPLRGDVLFRTTLPGTGLSLKMSPGAKYAFVDGMVFEQKKIVGTFKKVYDLQKKTEVPINFKQSKDSGSASRVSSQGYLAFVSRDTKEIQVWNIPEKTQVFSRAFEPDRQVHSLNFAADGQRLFAAGIDRSLRLWDVTTGELLRDYPLPEPRWHTYRLEIAADDKTAVTVGSNSIVLLWSLASASGPQPPPTPAMVSAPQVFELNAVNGPPAVTKPPAATPPPAQLASAAPRIAAAATAKVNIPAESARETAHKLIRDIFGADFAKAKRPADKLALAEKLQSQAAQSQAAAEKYVLLTEARDLACEAGDASTFFKSLEALDEAFVVDVAEMALVGGNLLAEKLAPKARYDLAKGLLPFADRALREDQYDAAAKLVDLALAAARKAKDGILVKQIIERKSNIQELKKQESEINAARETLAKSADDEAANLAMGKFYCLLKDDWRRGLPLLNRSGDNPLQELAAQEIADPTTLNEQMKLADGWYTLGHAASGNEKAKYLSRAEQRYRKVLPELSGLTLVKVQKRLEELEGAAAR